MMDDLSKQLEDDLMGNSSKSPRENWAVQEILRLRARVEELEGGKPPARAKRSEVKDE